MLNKVLLLSFLRMIRLITFDFWNTLFVDKDENIRYDLRRAFALDVLRKFRPELGQNELDLALEVARLEFEEQWQTYTASTMDRFVRTVLSQLNMQVPEPEEKSIVDFFETVLLQHQPVMVPNAAEAVRFSKSRLLVGLISDAGYSPGSTLRRILKSHGLEECFHSFSFSNETGYLKPRSETFLRILKELNVQPSEAVHIGDLEYTDIAGAKQLGMKAIKFIGANESATRESIADAVIDDLSELPSLLDRLH